MLCEPQGFSYNRGGMPTFGYVSAEMTAGCLFTLQISPSTQVIVPRNKFKDPPSLSKWDGLGKRRRRDRAVSQCAPPTCPC